MGFFSDLKEDLSQAVNELMPEEALELAMAGSAEGEKVLSPEQPAEEESATTDKMDALDLSSMLDKLEEPKEDWDSPEEVVSAVQTEESGVDTLPVMPAEPVQALQSEAAEELQEIEEQIALASPVEETVPVSVSEPEDVLAAVEAPEADQIISELSEEEEENMDVQLQEQIQAEEPVKRVALDETAVVTEGMTVTGDIMSEGSMELIGTVIGNIEIYGKLNITGTIQGDSKAAEIYAEDADITGEVNSQGSVKIGQSSVVIGNIRAASAVIAGAVKGDIDVQGPVILDTTAIVMGNIKSKSVQINNGAVIEGLCSQCYADINPVSFFEDLKKKK